MGPGKEGTGAVVDHCSGIEQALCLAGEGDSWKRDRIDES